jgi:hypothetical protein
LIYDEIAGSVRELLGCDPSLDPTGRSSLLFGSIRQVSAFAATPFLRNHFKRKVVRQSQVKQLEIVQDLQELEQELVVKEG